MIMMTNKTKKELIVENWNLLYDVGIDVNARKDLGEIVKTKTRSKAWLLGGHTPVILLNGIRGCCCLDRVTPIVA
uniref:Uncharacterized protein n=1 Tax=viral metagenome TaxID=1070528 RepID=A0A6H1ZW99_9ZZZZ